MSAKKCHRLVLYSHKGGVGKTTLTVNIAFALAELGKSVLLVDSDPQCNLSSAVLHDDRLDALLDRSESPSGRTLWSAVKPVVEGIGLVRSIRPVHLTEGVRLIPGDIRLADFEAELSQAWGDCFQRRVRGFNVTTAISQLVSAAANDDGVDFVFYDSGPNIGPLNRVILLDCDAFIVPAAADVFSARALKTLGYTLVTWITNWETVLDLAPDDVPTLMGRPQLMGFIPQRFRPYADDMSSEQSGALARVEKQLHADLIAVLRRVDPALAPFSASQLRLGQVKDFASLIAASQRERVPVWKITKGNTNQRDEAQRIFSDIAERLVERMESPLS